MFWLFAALFCYIFIGIYLFITIDNVQEPQMLPTKDVTVMSFIITIVVVFWPLLLVAKAGNIIYRLFGEISYEKRIVLFRWVFVISCIIALAVFGPQLRELYRDDHIQTEQPLAAPLVTSNDTIRERPQVPHTRYEWYNDLNEPTDGTEL